jgi:broad specificity phosphatase PhoE
MGLLMPNEPKDIKDLIVTVRSRLRSGDSIDWDSLAVWSLNKLPKYLWSYWKEELKEKGITCQRFLRILKLRTADMIEWGLRNSISWEELVKRLEATVESYSPRGVKHENSS